MKERLIQEIEYAERFIQSLKEFNDIGGTQSWWQGRKALAEELLLEVENNETRTKRNDYCSGRVHFD